MPGPLEGKVALITGSSRGIGKAIALQLAQDGAEIVVTGRSEESTAALPGSIGETKTAIEALGRKALAVRMDVNIDADLKRALDETLAAFGRIDILVNNAAFVGVIGGFLDADVDQLDASYRTNMRAPFVLSQLVGRKMAEAGGGTIVHISSPAARNPAPPTAGGDPPRFNQGPIYGMSKAALDRLGSGAARELSEKGIASVTIYPGFTLTERMMANPRPGLDLSRAEPMDGTAKAVAIVCRDPMAYNGKILPWREVVEPKS